MNSIDFDEKRSKDLAEFLDRAGLSLLKAGATAALGSIAAAIALVVIAGHIGAVKSVDYVDSEFNIKENVANWAK
jgi:hypothetical protein